MQARETVQSLKHAAAMGETSVGAATQTQMQLSKWYALQVRPTKELGVHRSLTAKGFSTLLPTSRVTQRARSGTRLVRRALFPGYLFCLLNPLENHTAMLFTPDVIGLVGRRESASPIPLSDAEIASIKRIADSGAPVQPWPYRRPGDQVELLAGPLRGLQGVIVSTDKTTHIVVSIELLQRSIALQIPPEWAYVNQPCPDIALRSGSAGA